MIERSNIQNLVALSPMQEGILFHALYEQAGETYFEQALLRVQGALDIACFERAWNELLRRHEALRTVFVVKNVPKPLQVVLRERQIPLAFRDLSGLGEVEQREAVEAYRREDIARPFDLSKDVLLRVGLLRMQPELHMVVLSFHHILMDGWCQDILQRELMVIYQAFRQGQPSPLPAVAPPFRRYVKWLEQQDRAGALAFWTRYLDGYTQAVPFARGPAPADSTPAALEHHHLELSPEKTAALTALAARCGVTVGTLVQTVWGLQLCASRGARDAVFATTVSGRPPEIDGVESIIGLFINAVPTRIRVREDESWLELLRRVQRELAESTPYQFCPLADVQGQTPLKRQLLDHVVVIENFLQEDVSRVQEREAAAGLRVSQVDILERTNYPLTVQVHLGERLRFGFQFQTPRAERAEVLAAGRRLEAVLDAALRPDEPVGKVLGQLAAEAPAKPAAKAARPVPVLPVVISATFTADPVMPYVRWWCAQASIPTEVAVAPYNQVFQQLLDPSSAMARNKGVNVILARCEDWVRDAEELPEEARLAHLSSTFDRFVSALESQPADRATLVGLFPVTGQYARSARERELLEELARKLARVVERAPALRALDLTRLAEQFRIDEVVDPRQDRAGHLPYTEAFFAALGTSIARALRALRHEPFKVIAVDCDNTLWRGVCGEDGALGVEIGPGHQALQRFLVDRVAEGFLIVLCSKNVERDVWEVFDRHPGMILGRKHVVATRINWRPKPENLVELSQELGLGLNSFLFLDDSGVECEQVMRECPEVLAIRVPSDPAALPALLSHVWGVDVWRATEEDRRRSEMYQAETQREDERRSAASLEVFLASLDLRVRMTRISSAQRARAAQLTQRTNQFNLSTRRRTEAELTRLLEEPEFLGLAVTVSDRFGDYGLVGLVFARPEARSLVIDTFLLSCRVLGRGVEDAIMATLGGISRERGLEQVRALFVPTARNEPFRDFIARAGWHLDSESEAGRLYTVAVAALPAMPAHARCELDLIGEPEVPRAEAVAPPEPVQAPAVVSAPQPTVVASQGPGASYSPEERAWLEAREKDARLRHRWHYLPLLHSTGARLLALPVEPEAASQAVASSTPLRTAAELALAAIWRDILPRTSPGADDDFFAQGGHSIKAVQLLSRIHRDLGVEVTLKEIFDHPVLADMARLVERAGRTASAPIPEAPAMADYPLSVTQRRLWALEYLQGGASAYVMSGAVEIRGELDVEALEGAFRHVVTRHEVLRTAFVLEGDQPRQVVRPEVPFLLERVDLSGAGSREERLAAARALAEQEAAFRFDLTRGGLIRAVLARLDPAHHVFVLSLHHLVGDGWSHGVLLEEVAACYRALRRKESPALPALRIQYKDFAAWQESSLRGPTAEQHRRYWLEALSGEVPVLEFPTDWPRPAVASFEGRSHVMVLDPALTEGLYALCRQHGVTLFMGLMAALRTLLFRYTGQQDSIVGTVVAGRAHPDLERQIGPYLNVVALREAVRGAEPFSELLRRVRKGTLEAFEHQDYPFDTLVEELGLQRDPSRSPLFDVMLVVQDGERAEPELEGARLSAFGGESGAGKFDLTFNVTPRRGTVEIRIEYRPDLFSAARIARMEGHLRTLVAHAIREPDRALHGLELLTPAERTALLSPLPEGPGDARLDSTLVDLFEQQVVATPEQVAIISGSERVSYAELDRLAGAIAGQLREALGLAEGTVVGVLLSRGVWSTAAQVGILKAGCVYLPLEPELPEARLRYMIGDSRCGAILTDAKGVQRLGELEGALLVDVERLVEQAPIPRVERSRRCSDAAYIIYTSGSTGMPKGVECHHRGLINTVIEQIHGFQIERASRVLQFASLAFDASMSEVWTALLAGATLVVAGREVIENTSAFTAYLAEHNVSVATLPPVYLSALERHELPTLRTLVTAGEAANAEDAKWYAKRKRYINAYGPAECSVCVSMYEVKEGEEYARGIPVGQALRNVGVVVADGELNALPVGVVGEVCVRGVGVARGYLGRPELTAEKFVEHAEYGRVYRTGDLGRWSEQGQLEFVGRKDGQVKIRGQRVEVEEVRRRVLSLAGVEEAVVLVEEVAGGKELAAYVVGGEGVSEGEVRRWVGQGLPAAMVPGKVRVLEQLPLTANGKVDREALKRWEQQQPRPGVAEESRPRTEAEQVLGEAWQRVLGVERVGLRENYFELGGDSIKAIRVSSEVRKKGWQVEVRQVFMHPTVEELSVWMKRRKEEKREEGRGEVELTPIQRWLLERVEEKHRDHFNNAVMLKMEGGERVEREALKRALKQVEMQHEALRLRWKEEEGGKVRQWYGEEEGEREWLEEKEVGPGEGWQQQLEQEAERLQRSLSLEKGPVWRAGLVRTPEGERVLWVVHHVSVDAVSWGVLVEDLASAYRQAVEGAATLVLPERSDSFQAWSRFLHSYASSAEVRADEPYWTAVDAEVRQLGALPREVAIPGAGAEVAAKLQVELDAEHTAELLRKAGALGRLGMSGLLVTGLARAFHGWTGTPRLALAMEGHGREHVPAELDISRTVGWFTALYPVIVDARQPAAVDEHLRAVMKALRSAARRGLSYGLLRYLTSSESSSSRLCAEPAVGFNYLGEMRESSVGGFVEASESTGSSRSPRAELLRDIEIDVLVKQGRLYLQLAYDRQRFTEATMRRLAEGTVQEALQVARRASVRNPAAGPVRLYFLPFAGASAEAYQPFQTRLGGEIEVVPVELPGRGVRASEPPLGGIGEMAEAVLERIRADGDGPYALFGHSMGALLAYEVARAAAVAGLEEPRHVVCSGLGAPWRLPVREQPLADSELLSGLLLSAQVDDEERHRRLALLRADVEAVERYRHQPGQSLSAPLLILTGNQEGISDEDVQAWKDATRGGMMARRFEGNHHFLFENAARIAELISETLLE
ncbi:non-ribosomal peptide synthetase [Hyalangium versicolor]|uniref:non-ribosomal peptide synthetase n=1 Tax=Hyalangium versicolor TaxID=2861190 RepID=UPI001CCD0121|nr:non-ribosomal peptide synthetase [Hyalangium versicolor]